MKRIFISLWIVLICHNITAQLPPLPGDTCTSIQTPTNVSIQAWDYVEFDQNSFELAEAEAADWIEDHHSNAVRVAPASRTYNCLGYAWHSSDGGDNFWIYPYDTLSYPNIFKYFWESATYQQTNDVNGTKVFYTAGVHSAIVISPGLFESKWGYWPRYRHYVGDITPYSGTSYQYYWVPVSGDDIICSSQSYSTLSISGATYSWEGSMVSISGSGSSITATKTSNGSGYIQTQISSPYSGTTVKSVKKIWAGTPILNVTGPDEGYVYNTYTFYANPDPSSNPTSYTWILNPLNGNNVYNYGSYADIAFYNPYDGYQVVANAQNTCGTGDWSLTNIWIYDGEGEGYSMSPNPASETVTITLTRSTNFNIKTEEAKSEDSNTIYIIRIFDLYGVLHYSTTRSGESFTFPVSSLKDGNSIVKINNREKVSNLKLIVKH